MTTPVTSIVPGALAILREEAQSLTGVQPALERVAPGHAAIAHAFPGGDPLPAVVGDLIRGVVEQSGARAGERQDAAGLAEPQAAVSLPLVRVAQPVAPGQVAHASMRIQNDEDAADECSLHLTDLLGPGGRIPAAHAQVTPRPLRIPPRGVAEARIEIRVPGSMPAGIYTGLLQTEDGESLRALVQVIVAT